MSSLEAGDATDNVIFATEPNDLYDDGVRGFDNMLDDDDGDGDELLTVNLTPRNQTAYDPKGKHGAGAVSKFNFNLDEPAAKPSQAAAAANGTAPPKRTI